MENSLRRQIFAFLALIIFLFSAVTKAEEPKTAVVVGDFAGSLRHPALAVALSQEIAEVLATHPKLTVLPRSAWMSQLSSESPVLYSGNAGAVGKGTNSRYVLSGTFREVESVLEITVRIYEAGSGASVGSTDLTIPLQDLKSVPPRVAEAVTEILKLPSHKFPEGAAQLSTLIDFGQGIKLGDQNKYAEAAKHFSNATGQEKDFKLSVSWQKEISKVGLQKSGDSVERMELMRLQGDTKQARQELEKAKTSGTNPEQLKLMEAEILMTEEKNPEAEKLLRELMQFQSTNPRILFDLSQVLRKNQKIDEAAQILLKAKKLNANDLEVNLALAELLQFKGDFPAAAKQFLAASDLALAQYNYQSALILVRRAKTMLPPSAEVLGREGKILLELGAIDDAEKELIEANHLDPKNSEVAAYLGRIYFLKGNNDQAITLLKNAVEGSPGDFFANYTLGLYYAKKTQKKDLELARKYLEAAVLVKSDVKEAWLTLARVYRSSQMFHEAEDAYDKARQLDPDDFILANEIGDFLHQIGKFQQAELQFTEAIRLNPDYVDANANLGNLYREQGKLTLADKLMARLAQIDPTAGFKGSVLFKQVLSLIRTFPTSAHAPQGTITLQRVALVDARIGGSAFSFRRILDQTSLSKPKLKAFVGVLEQALISQYSLQHFAEAKSAARKAGFSVDNFRSPTLMNGVCQSLGVDAVFIFRLEADPNPTEEPYRTQRFHLKLMFFERYSNSYFENVVSVLVPIEQYTAINFTPYILLVIGAAGIAAIVFYKLRKGYGNVVVKIIFDKKETAGYFALKLSRNPNDPWATRFDKKTKFAKKTRFKRHDEEYMVGDVTKFKRFPIGQHYLYLFGNIAERSGNTIIGTQSTMKPVEIKKNESTEVVFNLIQAEAYVEVFVNFENQPLVGAEVTCKESGLKATTQGNQGAVLYIKPGDYHLTAVFKDLRTTIPLKINDLKPKEVLIQVHGAYRLAAQGKHDEAAQVLLDHGEEVEAAKMFELGGNVAKACRVLGEKYMREEKFDKALACFEKCDDFNSMAAIYQRMGDMEKSYRYFGLDYLKTEQYQDAVRMFTEAKTYDLLAEAYEKMGDIPNQYHSLGVHYRSKGQDLEAAGAFETGEHFKEAAECYERVGNHIKAGEIYAKGGLFQEAAENFVKGGDQTRAAMAYEKGGKLEDAAKLYASSGDNTKAPRVLMEAGKYMEAAAAYRTSGLLDEALGALRQVNPTSPNFSDACELMAQIFDDKNEPSLALQSVQRGLQQIVIEGKNLERFYTLGERQEKAGEIVEAIRTYEKILSVNHEFKDLSHHVRELKEKLQGQTQMGRSIHLAPGGAPQDIPTTSRYEIIKEVGRGGMGVVYQAKDKLLERVVAFKLLPEEIKDNPQMLEAFMKEAKAAAKLSHPNLVTVFDTGQENGRTFISMEFVDGQTLKKVLQMIPQNLRLQDILTVSLMICDALSYAHKNQIIHRDIKPSNVMINKNRQVKVMDFGLATVLQKAALDKTMMRGTPLYMAPEMILGTNVDYRSDIYSMGITLYEMATKQVPFSTGDVHYHQIHTPPPNPHDINPNLPEALCKIILKAIAKKQDDRYQTMDELINDLKSLAPASEVVTHH